MWKKFIIYILSEAFQSFFKRLLLAQFWPKNENSEFVLILNIMKFPTIFCWAKFDKKELGTMDYVRHGKIMVKYRAVSGQIAALYFTMFIK